VSTSPAAHLARLRQQYGARWRIDREPGPQQETGSGPGWTGPGTYVAIRRADGRTVREHSAAALENSLRTAES
jgi:hypothetical protein